MFLSVLHQNKALANFHKREQGLKAGCFFDYIRVCKHNAEVRWNEHNNLNKSSEPSKHHPNNISQCFTWTVISNAPKNAKSKKNLQASYIAILKTDLNKQIDFERLTLFKNGA